MVGGRCAYCREPVTHARSSHPVHQSGGPIIHPDRSNWGSLGRRSVIGLNVIGSSVPSTFIVIFAEGRVQRIILRRGRPVNALVSLSAGPNASYVGGVRVRRYAGPIEGRRLQTISGATVHCGLEHDETHRHVGTGFTVLAMAFNPSVAGASPALTPPPPDFLFARRSARARFVRARAR